MTQQPASGRGAAKPAFDGSPWPGVRLALPQGDTATIALQGGQVLSWCTADGAERLYQSPLAATDGSRAIRAGVQVCFPQFANRGPLPKHGLVRIPAWSLVQGHEGGDRAVLELRDTAATRALWPHRFQVRIAFTLAPGRLRIDFTAANTGDEAFDFTMALHSYLRTQDIASTRLHGLGGDGWFDKVTQTRHPRGVTAPDDALAIVGEVDRVYDRLPVGDELAAADRSLAPLLLTEPRGGLRITQAGSMTETVVWNPGAALCATFDDMPPDGWQSMLCAEAAHVEQPVPLAPGAQWHGWQQLEALPPPHDPA